MSFKLRNKEGKLPLLWAIVIGFSISFLVCIALVISAPLAGDILGGVVNQEQVDNMIALAAALTSFWWWIMVSVIGFTISTCVFRTMFSVE